MLTDRVIDGILRRLPGQAISIRRMRKLWTQEEMERFERELVYLTNRYSLERLIDGYVCFTGSVMEETKYFREHGDYRYHSFAEVDHNVYADEEKMTLYMLGLFLTEYLWETVLRIHRFFEATIRGAWGERYLEIGPGHGKYFLEAYNLRQFKKYVAVDVSPTAIQMTDEYMKQWEISNGGGVRASLRGRNAHGYVGQI